MLTWCVTVQCDVVLRVVPAVFSLFLYCALQFHSEVTVAGAHRVFRDDILCDDIISHVGMRVYVWEVAACGLPSRQL